MQEKENTGREIPHRDLKPTESLVRVIYQYEDGEIACLEGENVTKFFGDIDRILSFVGVTRSRMIPKDFLDVDWKILNKEEAAGLLSEEPPGNPWKK
ncbi:MAG: hypothetical protein ACD_30C00112G0027 [uncultured bacterium]|uniref:Uncharacterized protein n=4 Tax=Candidatus Daviesiibacteriota TaxID=1752718 RepID=A0A0G0EUF5_9BACT|nr:MAG: hypothetical protein ACD_30C00112G0027 [uncultured bacterium]KKQ10553.1 MAG: hypothetical protein US19_C0003G0048 [Candidatus Daviesbacteria bacterium GW2011_GWB1_36_5]KKQ15296.1 MAG: hypothetical protein US28_C0019G0029 [Candidatus Daviesbacteria bacterium GW2011_GWA1_36_8]OGE17186.1 MAG: hypothetical protein A2858_00585 [Candidatus Daviesbacteria bacterium RIFCSPHIGHO2_01_FULL_36_37]OGE35967.1 MAG: hypothetical protein A3E66_01580 [Candidatus Daviesbacteria bacterium RIFCSPHIGHO2_12_F